MKTEPALVWFRQDLRLDDNAALTAAIETGRPVLPLFIWSPDEEGDWPPGAASRAWLRESLSTLSASLTEAGTALVLRRGDSLDALTDVIDDTGASAVYVNRRYEPSPARRDAKIADALSGRGIHVHAFDDALLFDPESVLNQSGEPYRVFTPFWKRLLDLEDPGAHTPVPRTITGPATRPVSLDLDDVLPASDVVPDSLWRPGEAGANDALYAFLDDVHAGYTKSRDLPGIRGTSRLSPHLHFGELSPRRVWFEVRMATRSEGGMSDPFLRQLAWREFSYYLLHHYPDSPVNPLRAAFRAFPWREDRDAFEAWTRGRTGYPFVDAGMRELLHTGWMHNRVRMVAASFLIKHLLIHWREGASWFWERLVDADLANNTMGWQWVAGCGADAAPFFRIFNPVMQGRKFDPDGTYVRTWVPELANLPDGLIHAPWEAQKDVLADAGITLGETYPEPMVDHAFARGRALAAYSELNTRHMSIT